MLYRILLFVHVLGVVVWVGSGFLFLIFTERAVRTGNRATVQTIVEEGDRLGKVLFGPLSLAVLASGIALVIDGGWGFGTPFVIGGLGGIGASILVGALFIERISKRLQTSLESSSSDGFDRDALLQLRNVGRFDLAIMTIVIFLMTVKPGT